MSRRFMWQQQIIGNCDEIFVIEIYNSLKEKVSEKGKFIITIMRLKYP